VDPGGSGVLEAGRILHDQAGGLIMRTPGLSKRSRVYDGYLRIVSLPNKGRGIEIFAADPKTGDGVIPTPTRSSTRATARRDAPARGAARFACDGSRRRI
jgi:hypothetical protein